MSHWHDGRRRATLLPPYPQPPGTNDLSSRVSRLEVHQWHTTHSMERIEAESLLRASDLRSDIEVLVEKLDQIQGHIGTARTLAGWAPSIARYLLAAVLFGLFLAGKISVEALKPFLAVLGLPTG